MASVVDHLQKLREERVAREKARIEKLKQLNLKKYNNAESLFMRPTSAKPVTALPKSASAIPVKNKPYMNGPLNRTTSAPNKSIAEPQKIDVKKNFTKPYSKPNPPNTPNEKLAKNKFHQKVPKIEVAGIKIELPDVPVRKSMLNKSTVDVQKLIPNKKRIGIESKNDKIDGKNKDVLAAKTDRVQMRKTLNFGYVGATTKSSTSTLSKSHDFKPVEKSRKSIAADFKPVEKSRKSIAAPKSNSNTQSVFERLYKPKTVPKVQIDEVTKLKTNPEYLRKIMKNASVLTKRHTVFETTKPRAPQAPIRRSISAVHFKRISKSELSNCFHKWSSVGEKINTLHLKEINEDDKIREDKVVSAIKSERKKVKFQTFGLNTPRPEELQARLQNWLQKRGKSLDSYHHLQCFGIHHLAHNIRPLELEAPKFDEENKENIPLESDSDDDSFDDNMNDPVNEHVKEVDDLVSADKDFEKNKWRSYRSDSIYDMNDSNNTTLTSAETPRPVDDLLMGALYDLTNLLHEGFDRDQCARWLRAIRERYPRAPETAAYWECRAALEESRGDLPTTLQCWEEALANGVERSVVESNLDQLLDKFMQLKISPNSGKKHADPKFIDIRNIFKSSIIRFAVQKAKLRQSQSSPKYICTPVRRSGRLSRTPLQPASARRAVTTHGAVFVPNASMAWTP